MFKSVLVDKMRRWDLAQKTGSRVGGADEEINPIISNFCFGRIAGYCQEDAKRNHSTVIST
jgi:hypothetical protein